MKLYDFIRSRKKHKAKIFSRWHMTLLLNMQSDPELLEACCEDDYYLRVANIDFMKYRLKKRLKTIQHDVP